MYFRRRIALPLVTAAALSWAALSPAVGQVPATGAVATTAPATTGPAAVDITFNTDEAPQLRDWAEHTLKPVLVEWYPKVAAELPIPGHQPPTHFDIRFTNSYKGVAATGGVHVVANTDWFEKNLKGESVGALLHEMVHVVQLGTYRNRRAAKRMPSWLLEGTCDYIRWFQFEPNHPHPHGDRYHYDDSYRTTATFLKYVVDRYDKDFLAQVNAASYKGVYSDDLWKQYTGKTVQQLGSEWEKSIGGTGAPHAPATRPVWNRPGSTRPTSRPSQP